MAGDTVDDGALTLPASVTGTAAFVRQRFGVRPMMPHQRQMARAMPEFGGQLQSRMLAMSLIGEPLSDEVAPRFSRDVDAADSGEGALPVAPHASPLRQVQAARQGAAAWGDAE
jgi:hypothetical protein